MERIRIRELELLFTPSGIEGRKGAFQHFFSYQRGALFPFFTLLILAGREKEEKRVLQIIESYDLPVIREVISVVSKAMDWKKFQQFPQLKLVYSAKPQDVILTSLKDGLRAMSPSSQAVILFLANKPLISIESLEKLIRSSLKEKRDILVPVVKGELSHPIIIPRETAVQMLKIRKEMGIPYFIKRWRKEVPCD
jgi:CTP:molybdopterin cytidylyltransferase MocA